MPTSNALLASVEAKVWEQFRGRGAAAQLERGQVLQRSGEDVELVQFPLTAVLVLGVETVAGEGVNVALLGAEGAVGIFEACGSRQNHCRAMVQIGGKVWQCPAAVYRALHEASPGLRTAVHKYMETLLAEARQNVACNALHTVDNRLARTLVDACDKSRSLQLPITQEALAQLLGVQRTTIAASVSALQRAGLIRSGRGPLEVVDYERLEEAACSCRETLAFSRREIQSRNAPVCEA
ncbi:Crp/Fnr family transcriptional regulator [Phenylobacterium sp. J426]|uniref:Crp/Fnr family transcriptional regulator n=1 Tax=Phenylobacterium sp. J426 TaxID=2898439 RepID=UPI002151D7C8|nr:Crp/Fnr family transcriptional regulator [Phenylobacterium sp. J426]MCR5876872.1 Crp/Fnr family transcriptional regulator [Phenylobacterium sp. J426]